MSDLLAAINGWLNAELVAASQTSLVTSILFFLCLLLGLYLCEFIAYKLVKSGSIGHSVTRVLLLPGVFIHELAHYICAFMSGFKSVKLVMLPANANPNVLGHVTYSYRPGLISYLGIIVTSIAPLPMGAACLVLLMYGFDIDASIVFNPSHIAEPQALVGFIKNVIHAFIDLGWWKATVLIYFYVVISMTMMPSYYDLNALLVPALYVGALILLICVLLTLLHFSLIPYLHIGLLTVNKGLEISLVAAMFGLSLLVVIKGAAALVVGALNVVKALTQQ